ncbi:oligosaccharide flippase family protein [Riemerella anatipestifer]|uniref:oligosaccharide flippase family protein n=1 Tax=Riemerella anatipestifer TaxID=34085 RepID=UPI001EC18150|nr:oligosaccharide flippase family protein [Riemerella anatipestifer]MRM83763.1 flippase [Riemerella anatipestifer]
MLDIKNIKEVILGNKKIIENYFFMTFLQLLNSFFYLLIYPYLIRVFGADLYGVFVFGTSIAAYFTFWVNFGFDLPATKMIAQNVDNQNVLNDTVSSIFTAKVYLFLISSIVFSLVLYFVPLFQENWKIFGLCYLAIFSHILFPQWFFQGIQKMRVVTGIQLVCKILSLPFIYLFVNDNNDLILYTLIVSCTSLFGGVIAFFMLRYRYNILVSLKKTYHLRAWFIEALPFFYSSIIGALKEYSTPILIGLFFGMKEVAVYDLANKIVIVPRTLFMSVNAAIFPKLINNIRNSIVKKIIFWETIVSLGVILSIVVFGKYVVEIMGGKGMEAAYYLAILLSITIMSWLVVGAYINFVFIPNNKNYYITINQLIALVTFIFFTIVGLLIYNNILILGGAIALSGIFEILYCKYKTYKHEML